jgi:ABC-2 type transport system permease protein
MSTPVPAAGGMAGLREELAKVPAFFRRDLLVMWSYRLAFFADWIGMFSQVVLFYLIGRLVNPGTLPSFGGRPTSYIEFVTVGIALSSFLQVTLTRLSAAIREEQLTGTLESVLVTPTSAITWQLGSMAYDLAYIPIRTLLFLLLVSGFFGVDLAVDGLVPTAAILLAFIPFAWGLGMISAGAVLTFRRGGGAVGVAVFVLVVTSNSYFPVEVLPSWVEPIVAINPLTITLDGMRAALLGGEGWAAAWPAILTVAPMSAGSMIVGMAGFRWALGRERRQGTLGLY